MMDNLALSLMILMSRLLLTFNIFKVHNQHYFSSASYVHHRYRRFSVLVLHH